MWTLRQSGKVNIKIHGYVCRLPVYKTVDHSQIKQYIGSVD